MKKFAVKVHFTGPGYVRRAETVADFYAETRQQAIDKALMRVASTPLLDGMSVYKVTAMILKYDAKEPKEKSATDKISGRPADK